MVNMTIIANRFIVAILPSAAVFANEFNSGARLHHIDHYKQLFEEWRQQYGVFFSNQLDYQLRLNIFADNHDLIEEHNAELSFRKHSYSLAHNQFSHLTWEEFRAHRTGLIATEEFSDVLTLQSPFKVDSYVSELPPFIDWVQRGAVTSVKNQGMCGSCWAFSATGAIEGAVAALTGNLVDLSEQQMIDCDGADYGCDGGNMISAYQWVKNTGGMCSLQDYEYTGMFPLIKKCWHRVKSTAQDVMEALQLRPLAVAIEADQRGFQFYSSGVFDGACGSNLNHGVLLVGYGTTEGGKDFWKVKNSWGESWGNNGYILLARNKNETSTGQCGILMSVTFPIMSSEVIKISDVSEPDDVDEKSSNAKQATSVRTNSSKKILGEVPLFSSSEASAGIINWRSKSEPVKYVNWNSSASAIDCGGGTAVFDDIVVDPAEPKRGEVVALSASGVLTKPLMDGTYLLSVQIKGAVVYKHTGSVCGSTEASLPLGLGKISMTGFECPTSPGPVSYSLSVELPQIAPSGIYKIYLKDQDAVELMCLETTLSI